MATLISVLCKLGIQQAAALRLSESMNYWSGRSCDVGVHGKNITELFDYIFLASAYKVKLYRLERWSENKKQIAFMARGIEESNNNGLDRSKSANEGADKQSNDNDKTSNQHLDLSTSNWLATRCNILQIISGAETSNEQLYWDSVLLPEANRINYLEDPNGYYCAFGCNKLLIDGDIVQEWRRRKAYLMKLA